MDLGLDAKTVGSVHCFLARNIDDPYYTCADGVGVLEPATEALLDALISTFDPAGVPYCVPLAPGAQPAQLPFWLRARGFTPAFSVAVFVRDASPPNPVRNDIRVERVSPIDAGTFARINAEAFGQNPHAALAFDRHHDGGELPCQFFVFMQIIESHAGANHRIDDVTQGMNPHMGCSGGDRCRVTGLGCGLIHDDWLVQWCPPVIPQFQVRRCFIMGEQRGMPLQQIKRAAGFEQG